MAKAVIQLKILLGCEKSGAVRDEFAKRGHDAWSCDFKESEKPGNHIKGDVFEALKDFWDMAIIFPPCTHLASSGAKHFKFKRIDGRQKNAIEFFMRVVEEIEKIGKGAIENPIGIMSTIYRGPDQYIQPHFFGDSFQKNTCLWLWNLPKLFHAKEIDLFNDKITHVDPGEFVVTKSGKKLPKWYSDAKKSDPEKTSETRSRTFPGIAAAMAEQWG